MIITDPKTIDRTEKIIASSGFFNPIHVGHLQLLQQSKALGGKLIVIVNNDAQAILKHGRSFMPENERLMIIDNLKCVDYVFLSIDTNATVVESLKLIKPNVFTKGGDRFNSEIPEAAICRELGITMIDGLGAKIQSSSSLISKSVSK